jgi:hypothetical protein
MATKTTIETDSAGNTFRMVRQKTQVTCGPAACLIMFANIYDKDPDADEGGVIALSKMYPDAWTQQKGANIDNLAKVMGQMMMRVEVKRFTGGLTDLKTALRTRIRPKKPALAFLQWEQASGIIVGHFAVVGAARAAGDTYTLLDPYFGLQEMSGMPFYYPNTDEPDQPSLQFTGAVALLL